MAPRATRREPTSTDGSSVWTRPVRGARGPAPGFSLATIAEAGIDLADRGGLDAVSMRAVASAMGTSAGSLYRYVASRDELIDLMTDGVVAEDVLEVQEGSRDDQVIGLAVARLALHRRHPWLADAVASPRVLGPNGLDWFDAFLAVLAPIPRSTNVKMELIAIVVGVVTLFSRSESAIGTRQVTPAELFGAIDPDRHRHLVEALAGAAAGERPDDLFERTIRAIAHGLLGDSPTT